MNRIILNETSYYGAGCRTAIADEIKKRGFSKVLLVTDKDLIKFGVAAKIEQVLENAGIPYEIYSEINKMEKARTTIDSFPVYKELFGKYALAALLALLLELVLNWFVIRRFV